MADRKPPTTQIDALRAIINDARLACDHPNSTPAVTQLMLTKPFLRRLAKAHCQLHLLAIGLNHEIRLCLKQGDDAGEESATARQLEFWPERHRAIVADIDRAAVYVPSRREFVPLQPDALTPEQVREAGEYLITKGQHCVRIGTRLLTLAEMGWIVASPPIQSDQAPVDADHRSPAG